MVLNPTNDFFSSSFSYPYDNLIVGCSYNIDSLYVELTRFIFKNFPNRNGIFFKNYLKEPVVADVTEFSADNLSRLYRVDELHAKRVTELSVSLFDQLEPPIRVAVCRPSGTPAKSDVIAKPSIVCVGRTATGQQRIPLV